MGILPRRLLASTVNPGSHTWALDGAHGCRARSPRQKSGIRTSLRAIRYISLQKCASWYRCTNLARSPLARVRISHF